MFSIKIEIPPSDLESGYNHVNHARTLNYLEHARLQYLEQIGYPNSQLISEELFLVIVKIEIRYKREIFAGAYDMTVEDVRVENKSLYMHQRVLNEKNKECVVADYEFRLVDGKTKRSIGFPERFLAVI